MRIIKKIIVLLFMILVTFLLNLPKCGEVKAVSDINVLYIGNSKTYYNIFPRMYRYLAIAAEKNDAKLTAIVAGGRTLEQHATKLESIHDTNGKIRTYAEAKEYVQQKNKNWKLLEDEYIAYKSAFDKNWSYVVLQEQTDNAKDEKKMLGPSQRIINVLKTYGKNKNFKVVYNAIWPQYPDTSIYKTRAEQMAQLKAEQTKINIANKAVANKTGGIVSYSGQAVYNYLNSNSEESYLTMYISDKNHPTQAASYLSACCLYYTIYGESPVGINYYGNVKDVASNPIINLNYSRDASQNGSNFTGRKELKALTSTEATKLQKVAKNVTEENTAPTVNSIKASITEATNQNIVLTVNAEDRVCGITGYSWDNKTWETSKTKEITKNGTYTVYVKNKKNKISSKSITISNIDKKAPTINDITASKIETTNQNIVLTVNATDSGLGISEYSWDNKTWGANKTKEITKNGTYTVYVKDKAGNISSKSITITNIDKTAPIITGVENGQTYNDIVTPIITDENLESVELNKDGSKVENYINGSRITDNGKYTLVAKDKADNTTSIDFIVNIPTETIELSNIKVTTLPNKTEYIVGQNIDLTGMVVTANYTNSSTKDVTSEVTCTPTKLETVGQQTITVTYVGCKDTFDVTVKAVELSSIAMTTPPTKTSYIEGENFDSAGMVVTAAYNDGSTKVVTDYTVADGNNLTLGKTNVTISYTEDGVTKTVTQAITVVAKEEGKLEIEVGTYEEEIEDNIRYIKDITPKTTIEGLKNNVKTNGTIKIKKGIEEIRDENTKICTGMTVEIALNDEKVEYIVIVTGDCNGSGTANVSDLTKLMISRAESLAQNKDESKILKGAYEKAVDLNGDGKINSVDITRLLMYIAENK